jgi:signal transduction histidine kinase
VDCTRKISAGEPYSFEVSKTEEIRVVIQAFNVMLAKLEQREKQVIRSEKLAAVGTLMAGVAHELNNPLSNAGISAQILLEEMKEPEEVNKAFQMDMLEQIVEQTDRARDIVRSLLEFSREKAVKPSQFMVSEILDRTAKLVRGDVPTHVTFSLAVETDGLFRADKLKLQQALINLLRNAFQAVGDEGEVELKGSLDERENQVRFSVKDNGPGIPAEIREKIFDPFFTTKEVGEGSGLGLSVAYDIINKHGGTITIESEKGRGTTFFITMPVQSSQQPLEEENESTQDTDSG